MKKKIKKLIKMKLFQMDGDLEENRGIVSMVSHRSPKPRLEIFYVGSNPTAPANLVM